MHLARRHPDRCRARLELHRTLADEHVHVRRVMHSNEERRCVRLHANAPSGDAQWGRVPAAYLEQHLAAQDFRLAGCGVRARSRLAVFRFASGMLPSSTRLDSPITVAYFLYGGCAARAFRAGERGGEHEARERGGDQYSCTRAQPARRLEHP